MQIKLHHFSIHYCNHNFVCVSPILSYKELSELVEATSEQLVDYQMALIATTILHDAPSQNWTSQKPFYEGIIIEAMFQFCHA